MEITTELLTEKFREYNRLYFNNELYLPRMRLLKSFRMCGYFSCKKIIGRRRLRGERLEVTCYYDWPEDALRDVIVHEMIHYYLAFKHIDNDLTHGEAFHEMSEYLNNKYGLHVTERIDTSDFKPSSCAPKLGYYLSKIF